MSRAVAAFSSRRSASRSRSLVKLDDHGGLLSAAELAIACGWDVTRLKAVVFGDGESFSYDRSPFALGQVVFHETPHGEYFVLTDAGREEVAELRREAWWARGRHRPA